MTEHNEGWIKTTCAYCGVGCGIEARPKHSGELEIRGDKEHPSNYGKLCTKGIALGETVIHDGRLLSPTLKTGHGDKALSWEDATTMVAERFTQTIQEHGPDSVAFYVSGQLLTEDYYVANKLIKGFMGTANIDSNSRLCMASSVVGHKRAFGSDTVPVCYEDLEQAELVVIVGSNLAWCHPVLFQRLRTAKQENPSLKIVVVDPRKTDTCELADTHLPIESGSDVALFNGLLAHLIQQDSLDHEFISSHTDHFEETIHAALSEQNIEQVTGLTEQQLIQFYSEFANTDKVITIYSQGVNQSSSGSDKVNAILNCHLATGKIGKAGCGPFSVTGQPNAMGGREIGALANTLTAHMEFDNPEHLRLVSDYWQTDTLATQPGLKAIDMFDAIDSGKIKAVWIMATNPMVSLPNSDKIRSALEKCPLVVVSDCIADTETSRLADVVLPAQGWSEKSGTVTNSERRISRQRRILPSPGEAKPDWWIISQVAHRMGFKEAFDYIHEGEIFSEYAKLTTLGNDNFERDLNLIGLTQLDDKGYSQLKPQQWPVTELQDQVVNQRLFSDGQFYTSNKRARFVAVNYQAPLAKADAKHPLILNSGRVRDHWHTMSRTGLSPKLAEHTTEPFVQVHPDTASKYQILDGQLAKVSNLQGEALVRAKVTSEVSPSQLFMPIHWNETTSKNSKPCTLIANTTDELSGQPEFKHSAVAISSFASVSCAVFISRDTLDLNDIDYWARQKVQGGYLYRIESILPVGELAAKLKEYLQADDQRLISSESHQGQAQWLILDDNKPTQLLSVQERFADWEVTRLIELYLQTDEQGNASGIMQTLANDPQSLTPA
ncbi:molybdopterin oxidoreductase family protein [Vibrio breoganii]|uniref:molybdopterin oxidoreductase family protein n=1 Tax=Vibrio breoganii TaxID=553239 RepID=UPI000C85AC70|nr:nitrate reductase [Vibrio breoganii]PMG83384.1 nitrate reductase [Vibrio breoganii]PMG95175.1 nitrate reductase [Vibrio breoganii]PMJ43898.1 nitrate reductase [Vibrio breoganii]PMK53188.1 nitrate reductase [Vibrio breoganii]PML37280.1 nitrate reductase [Vibrio breoganii]